MNDLPILFVPGLNCTPRVYMGLLPGLWQLGPVTVANHRGGESMAAIASAILGQAPPRFALVGFSMGGYLSFEILRQAPERVLALALLDTSARPDTAEQSENRRRLIALAERGGFANVPSLSFPGIVHPDHVGDARLFGLHRQMALETGAQGFIAQQKAIIGRPDSRPLLAAIAVPTAVIVGDADQVTPPEVAEEMAAGISGARLTVVPKAGHLALLEQPAVVERALVDWLGF